MVEFESQLAQDHDLRIRDKTAWGDVSIPDVTLKALSLIYQRHPEVGIVYIVSGDSIPIQPATRLFADWNVEPTATEARHKIHPFTSIIARSGTLAGETDEQFVDSESHPAYGENFSLNAYVLSTWGACIAQGYLAALKKTF